jgi:hypothetical protein
MKLFCTIILAYSLALAVLLCAALAHGNVVSRNGGGGGGGGGKIHKLYLFPSTWITITFEVWSQV